MDKSITFPFSFDWKCSKSWLYIKVVVFIQIYNLYTKKLKKQSIIILSKYEKFNKFIPEMRLIQPGFTCSACVPVL